MQGRSNHNTPQHLRRGAPLPYRPLAGVEPCRGGWFVVSGKLQGVSLFPEPPQIVETITDVLDSRPPYEIIALHAPIGLPGERTPGGRACDRQARKLLGTRRGSAISAPPTRSDVYDASGEGLSAVVRAQLARIREVQRDVASYHQRSVFEVHPELGFYQLNEDTPLRYAKRTHLGVEERLNLLQARMPGLERVVDNIPEGIRLPTVLDACVDLWTARRIAARAVARLPEVPEWNEDGLRMEMVR
jgi:predicted RNase H-like nuclease